MPHSLVYTGWDWPAVTQVQLVHTMYKQNIQDYRNKAFNKTMMELWLAEKITTNQQSTKSKTVQISGTTSTSQAIYVPFQKD